jgi:hypothetical protein
MLRVIIIFYCCLFCFQTSNFAQNVSQEKKAVEVRGKIVDFFGLPRQEVLVELQSIELASGSTKTERSTKTNNQGEYDFDNLPVGSYELTIYGEGFLKESRKTHFLQKGEILEMDFGLQVGTLSCVPKQFYGIVRNNDGKAIENATIILINAFNQDYRRFVRSGKSGEYSIEICAGGQFLVYASTPNYEVQVKSITTPRDTSESFSKEINFRLSKLALNK